MAKICPTSVTHKPNGVHQQLMYHEDGQPCSNPRCVDFKETKVERTETPNEKEYTVFEAADKFEINRLAKEAHAANKTWWFDLVTGEPLKRDKGGLMMLIVSEIAEAMEGARKNLPDDKLPHRSMEEVEMADALIRILDYCAGHNLDLGGAYVEKMKYNATRADHTAAERLKENGKKF